MSVFLLLVVIAVLSVAGYVLCRQRALKSVDGNVRRLHSLPGYYGWFGFILASVPALIALALWLIIQPMVIERQLSGFFPAEMIEDPSARTLLFADVRRVAAGLDTAVAQGAMTEDQAESVRTEFGSVRDRLAAVGVALGSEVTPEVLAAAQEYREMARVGVVGRAVLTLILSVAGLIFAIRATGPDFRARNRVEQVVLALLILSSTIAILTTVGIVLSMLTKSLRFFTMYPAADFFFNLTWSPNFRGEFGTGADPASVGHALHQLHLDAGGSADRAVRGDLSGGICVEPGAVGGEAADRGDCRHPDRGFRPFRACHGGALPARLLCPAVRPWQLGFLGDDGGDRDRHPEHPVHLVAGR